MREQQSLLGIRQHTGLGRDRVERVKGVLTWYLFSSAMISIPDFLMRNSVYKQFYVTKLLLTICSSCFFPPEVLHDGSWKAKFQARLVQTVVLLVCCHFSDCFKAFFPMLLGGNTFEFFMIDPNNFSHAKKIKYYYNI